MYRTAAYTQNGVQFFELQVTIDSRVIRLT